MATYVNDLRLKEIATGDESGTWGASTNTNLELIAEAFSYGTEASFSSDADATTTIADGATDPARSLYLKVTSGASLTATRTLTIAPNTVSKIWIIENATSGSQSINISQGSGSNVTIPNGDVKVVYSDGAGSGAAIVDAFINLKVTDPAQTNITSVGALDGGSITSGFGAIDTGSSNITTTGTVSGSTLTGTLSTAAQTNITSVGALDGGSITSGFGSIDVGSSAITTTGTVTGNNLAGTLTTAAQPNITSLGTLTALTGGTGDLNWDSGTLFVDSSANAVGIGTTSPSVALEISDSTANAILRLTRNDTIITVGNQIGALEFAGADADDAGVSAKIIAEAESGAGQTALAMYTGTPSALSERLRIDKDGNVGIGTASPADRLHVALDSSTTNAEVEVMRIEASSSGTPAVGFGPFIDFRGDRITGGVDAYGRIGFKADAMPSTQVDGAFVIQPAEDGTYTERFRVSSDGKVGIGTTAPNQLLDVSNTSGNANIVITASTTGTSSYTFGDSGGSFRGGMKYVHTDDELFLRSNGSDRITIDSSGNVGINTASPSTELHVVKASTTLPTIAGDTVGILESSGTAALSIISGTGNSIIRFGDSADENIGQIRYLHSSNSLDFTTNTNIAMTIDSSGNVGIGTTSPSTALEVNNSSAGATVATFEGDYSASGDVKLASFERNGGAVAAAITYADAATAMEFGTTTSHALLLTTGDTERMRIDSSGNVGIGTSSPASLLHLSSNAPTIQFSETDVGTENYIQASGGGFNFFADDSNAVASTKMGFYVDGTERMRIDSSGNLLVGKTSSSFASAGVELKPTEGLIATVDGSECAMLNRLSSTGTIQRFKQAGTDVGSISVTASATAYNTSSDARLKDVTGEARGLEVINELNPVSYNWKADGKADEGLIAQEVLDIVPNAVSGSEEDYYQMDYSKLVVHLVKGMKEQQTQIEALQSEINLLKGE